MNIHARNMIQAEFRQKIVEKFPIFGIVIDNLRVMGIMRLET